MVDSPSESAMRVSSTRVMWISFLFPFSFFLIEDPLIYKNDRRDKTGNYKHQIGLHSQLTSNKLVLGERERGGRGGYLPGERLKRGGIPRVSQSSKTRKGDTRKGQPHGEGGQRRKEGGRGCAETHRMHRRTQLNGSDGWWTRRGGTKAAGSFFAPLKGPPPKRPWRKGTSSSLS